MHMVSSIDPNDDEIQSLGDLGELTAEEDSLLSEKRWVLALVREFGGVEKIAQHMKEEYDSTKSNSPTRLKYLEMLVKWIQHFGAVDQPAAEATVEDMEGQIVVLLDRYFRAALEKCGLKTVVIEQVMATTRELIVGDTAS